MGSESFLLGLVVVVILAMLVHQDHVQLGGPHQLSEKRTQPFTLGSRQQRNIYQLLSTLITVFVGYRYQIYERKFKLTLIRSETNFSTRSESRSRSKFNCFNIYLCVC